MPHEVIMPALGMAQDTGHIVAWHKAAGDAVVSGDVLFEVETDKATMEVEAQASGTLTRVTAGEGADVPVGAPITTLQAGTFTVDGTLTLTDQRGRRSRLTATDVLTSNGVIHVIDRVILPSP